MAVRKRPVSNLLGLAVLGLLLEQPMHPYEMAATLRERNKDTSFKVRTGSLYDVVEALVRAAGSPSTALNVPDADRSAPCTPIPTWAARSS